MSAVLLSISMTGVSGGMFSFQATSIDSTDGFLTQKQKITTFLGTVTNLTNVARFLNPNGFFPVIEQVTSVLQSQNIMAFAIDTHCNKIYNYDFKNNQILPTIDLWTNGIFRCEFCGNLW